MFDYVCLLTGGYPLDKAMKLLREGKVPLLERLREQQKNKKTILLN